MPLPRQREKFIMEMIFMRRTICFLLILAFCLSLACPAFAAVKSPGEKGPVRWPSSWGDNPKTGDIIMFWVLVMVVSLVALGAVYMIYHRKFAR